MLHSKVFMLEGHTLAQLPNTNPMRNVAVCDTMTQMLKREDL